MQREKQKRSSCIYLIKETIPKRSKYEKNETNESYHSAKREKYIYLSIPSQFPHNRYAKPPPNIRSRSKAELWYRGSETIQLPSKEVTYHKPIRRHSLILLLVGVTSWSISMSERLKAKKTDRFGLVLEPFCMGIGWTFGLEENVRDLLRVSGGKLWRFPLP